MLITVTGNLVKYLSLKVYENDRDKVKDGNGEEGIPQRVWTINTTERVEWETGRSYWSRWSKYSDI